MSTVSALLDDSTWTLAQSRRAIEHAAGLEQQTRELVLTYRSHRVRAISGGSDQLSNEGRRTVIRAVAAHPTKTFFRLSRGRTCTLCGETIKRKAFEYAIEAKTVSMTLDVECYSLFLEAQVRSANRDGKPRS